MSWIWLLMVGASILCGAATGRMEEVAGAALERANAGVELCLAMVGVMCLWMGVMRVMEKSGMVMGLSRCLHPILSRLYPQHAKDAEVMGVVSANVAANLLGLGNAATPLGIRAAQCMAAGGGVASDSLCMLVVCNTASIQLIPATVASLRQAAGSASAFDILPAVWLASAVSVTVGIVAAKVMACVWR